jgi:hypothetical protein
MWMDDLDRETDISADGFVGIRLNYIKHMEPIINCINLLSLLLV